MPSSVRPAPAYIAASVASQIVTDHHNTQLREGYDSEDEDGSPFLENALFSEQALRLLNAFLDNLLFSFLSTARSPSLTAIRPAITEVLKPRLARDAMATADEELEGLLAGEDEEEFPSAGEKDNPQDKWDVEKVWKRTRLRIMVYTRLGEFEDEDEVRYVQQERGLSMDESDNHEAGLVSWASAIFLTSVIEFIAEQTLLVSGAAAFARMSAKMKKNAQTLAEGEEPQLERIVIEDFDVEKVALNSALGRLWRTWRKRVRSPLTPLSPGRISSRRSYASLASSHRRHRSEDTADESVREDVPDLPEHRITETDIAANIPLPMSDNDVAEIEVPGIARQPDEEDSGAQTPVPRPLRPTSFIMLASPESIKKRLGRDRPISMPPPEAGPFVFPPKSAEDTEDVPAEGPNDQSAMENTEEFESAVGATEEFKTPLERRFTDHSFIEEESQDGIYEYQRDTEAGASRAGASHEADMMAFAASTGIPLNMSPMRQSFHERSDEDTLETPTQAVRESAPQVLQIKRLSIEKSGPPEIVRTFSVRTSRSHSPRLPPPAEERSYLEDHSNDEAELIGVAHTSNIPIPAAPSPAESRSSGQSVGHVKHLEREVVDKESARRVVPPSPLSRQTPSPVSPLEPTAAPEKPSQRKESQPSRQPSGAASVSTRSPALSSLQEIENWGQQPKERHPVELKSSDSQRSVSRSPVQSRRSKETPLHGERTSPGKASRSRAGTDEGLTERATLKRVSTSSSGGKSVSTSILHSARDSDISVGRPRGLSGRMSEEDRVREFDSLVKGEETVKFTLTPQSMRDLDEPPVVRKVEAARPTTSVKVYPRVNAERENSFGSQPAPNNSSQNSLKRKTTGPRPLAREPRIQSESMRDFADFIRSTGPVNGESQPVQPFVSLSSAPRAKSPPTANTSAINSLGRRLSGRQSTIQSTTSAAGEGPSARPRIHMEPRSAATQRSGNDDLIDFIRQGPPGAGNGQHRIPRAVAPFRTTVDSDQFERMLDENGNVESAYGSQVSTASKTTHASANSRTGLLPAANVVQPAYSNTPQNLTGSLTNPEPQITRTRRRVKDPYAIDTDDEDEDLLTALPKSSRRQEESMLDFLNTMEPPPSNEPQPLLINGAAAAAAIARARSASNGTSHGGPTSSTVNQRNGPTVVKNGKPNPLFSTNITSDAPKAHRPRLQARDAGSNDSRAAKSATNDLADFLRTSGPPEPPRGPASPPPGTLKREESKRSTTKFWRRKN
jgi:hypothetical protein